MAYEMTTGYIDEKDVEYLESNVTTPDYKINYNDERFTQVQEDRDAALSEMEGTYDSMIGQSDKFYQDQIDASKEWADKQSQLQQEQSDFAIEQIEQQKDKAQKDYIKEQSGAYVDWQKQSNQYGVNAEKQASAGLAGTGYSESSQVAMYNQYQNRVMTARESYQNAVLNYNNAIKDARLQNNSVLAEIAYNSLQQQLELALQGFQYKNTLILDKTNKKIELDNIYYQRYQDVQQQMNTENAMAEQIRQYNQNYQLEIDKFNKEYQQWVATYNRGVDEFNAEMNLKERELQRLLDKDDAEAKAEAARLKEQIDARRQAHAEWEEEMYLKEQQFKLQEKAYLDSIGGDGGNTPITKDSGTTQQSVQISNKTDGTYIKTDYFKGNLPARTASAIQEFGVFSNGYQPMGIHGHGKVTKTGETTNVSTVTLSGETRTVKQNVWRTPDGKLWYWEGREMKYKPIPTSGGGGGASGSKPAHRVHR